MSVARRDTPPSIPVAKKVLFSAVILLFALLALEGALAVLPRALLVGRPARLDGDPAARTLLVCAGDSVTFGQNLPQHLSYPGLLGARVEELGLQGLSVFRYAEPSAELEDLSRKLLPDLAKLPDGARVVVLLMIGHNDFSDWRGQGARAAFGGAQGRARWLETDPRRLEGPRLLRIGAWGLNALREDAPELRADAATLARFERGITALARALPAGRGQLYLLTYPVPGAPPPEMQAATAQVLEHTRGLQRAVNERLRQLGAANALPVLDLERDLVVPDTWSEDWFQDNIHWTARTAQRVADLVWGAMLARGELPRGAEGEAGGSL